MNRHLDYYESLKLKSEIYYTDDGKYHRTDGPAIIDYTEWGTRYLEQYFINSVRHRLNGPARVGYYDNGRGDYEMFFVHGKLLVAFEKIYYNFSIEKLFKYTKEHPEFIEEISVFALHNNWLTEDQVVLLKSTKLFL